MNPDDETVVYQPQPPNNHWLHVAMPKSIGKFKCLRVLGTGMSTVYLAEDTVLGRHVAVKVLLARATNQPTTAQQDSRRNHILAEAKALAGLSLGGVAAVYEYGSEWLNIDGTSVEVDYLAYQYIEGETLDAWQARTSPSIHQIAEMVWSVAEILGRVHQTGFYHRDIKPQNILVGLDGRPMLIDFGLALRANGPVDSPGGICGTLRYLSPEQAAGDANRVDGRSDLYSLGAVCYQMLTGRLPLESQVGASITATLEMIRTRIPQPPEQIQPKIPVALSTIVLRLLSKRPADRFAGAAELLTALGKFLGKEEYIAADRARYLLVIQSHDRDWANFEADRTALFFQDVKPTVQESERVFEIHPSAFTHATTCRRVIDSSLKRIQAECLQGTELHVVPRITSMTAFALGLRMNNQYPCVLYHSQTGQLYRLWKIDRSIKNARSPQADVPRSLGFFQSSMIEPKQAGDVPSATACLAVQVGANAIAAEVTRWRDNYLPTAPVQLLTKRSRELSPEDEQAWLDAGSDIAHTIKSAEASEMFLFMDIPAVLALMAGDALGPWSGKSLHLMQYDPRSASRYEVLDLEER